MYAWPHNITNVTGLLQWSNNATSGYWAVLILVVIFFVSFIAVKVYTTPRALGAAAFITLLSTIMFRLLGLVNNVVIAAAILLNAIAAVWLIISESQG